MAKRNRTDEFLSPQPAKKARPSREAAFLSALSEDVTERPRGRPHRNVIASTSNSRSSRHPPREESSQEDDQSSRDDEESSSSSEVEDNSDSLDDDERPKTLKVSSSARRRQHAQSSKKVAARAVASKQKGKDRAKRYPEDMIPLIEDDDDSQDSVFRPRRKHGELFSRASKSKMVSKSKKQAPKSKSKSKPKPTPKPKYKSKSKSKRARSETSDSESEESEIERSDDDDDSSHRWPHVKFDDTWTVEMEEALRADFLEDDEESLQRTDPNQLALWRRADALFKMAPPNLLPPGPVSLENNTGKKNVDGWIDWSAPFCKSFSNLLCCPAFTDCPEFFAFLVKYALCVRLKRELPDLADIAIKKHDKVIARSWELFSPDSQSQPTGEFITAVRQSLAEVYGPNMNTPENIKLLKYIRKAVTKAVDPRGIHIGPTDLAKRDIDAVINGWDAYAAKRESLRSIDEYVKELAPSRGPPKTGELGHREKALGLKREFILNGERQLRILSRNRSMSPILGGDFGDETGQYLLEEGSSMSREPEISATPTSVGHIDT